MWNNAKKKKVMKSQRQPFTTLDKSGSELRLLDLLTTHGAHITLLAKPCHVDEWLKFVFKLLLWSSNPCKICENFFLQKLQFLKLNFFKELFCSNRL